MLDYLLGPFFKFKYYSYSLKYHIIICWTLCKVCFVCFLRFSWFLCFFLKFFLAREVGESHLNVIEMTARILRDVIVLTPPTASGASCVRWHLSPINLSQTTPKLSCSSLKHSMNSVARRNLFSHVRDSYFFPPPRRPECPYKGERLCFPQCRELNKYSLTVNAEVTFFFNGLKKKKKRKQF